MNDNELPVDDQQADLEPVNTVDLTVQDLTNIKRIIDLVAQRGAFVPSEFTSVGSVYDKLATFLETVAKQVGEQQVD